MPRQRRNVTAGKTRELGGYHCFHQPVLCRMCPEVDLARRPLELLHLFTSSACSALSSARGGGIEVEDAATSTAWLNVAPGYLNAQIERPHGTLLFLRGNSETRPHLDGIVLLLRTGGCTGIARAAVPCSHPTAQSDSDVTKESTKKVTDGP